MQLGDEGGVYVLLGGFAFRVTEVVHVDDGAVALEFSVEEVAEEGDGFGGDVDV